MHINDEVEEVGAYDTIYIPKRVQYIENTGDENWNLFASLIRHGELRMKW